LDLTTNDITEHLKSVPDDELYPEPPAQGCITTVSNVAIDSNVFVKGP
jgi:hypothetical protein